VSDADDVAAIQQYLKTAGLQVSNAVESCRASLDASTQARVDDLASRILAYVSASSPDLATGRALRGEFNAMVVELSQKGCGDIAKLIAEAPPQVLAPPPKGTPNPLLSFANLDTLEAVAVLALLYFAFKKGR
jgi:hypothetical protein